MTYNLAVQKDDGTHESVDDEDLENVVNGFASVSLGGYDAAYNGSTSNDAYIVYEIDLADWFTVNDAEADDATYWYSDGDYATGTIKEMPSLGEAFGSATPPVWHNKYSSVNNGPYVATNSVLAGEFVIPFDKVADTNTFELQLLGGENSDEILKTWTVALQDVVEGTGDTKYIHNIYRNQLYQIGKRGGGDNPDEPGEGPDEPQPLDKNQEMMLRINDNWEIIHDMVIE